MRCRAGLLVPMIKLPWAELLGLNSASPLSRDDRFESVVAGRLPSHPDRLAHRSDKVEGETMFGEAASGA